ncbi:MAG: phosphoribosyl-ATP diphosphatase [Alphaproteobacteria bacterium]|jgi:phosphoribosyl-ATP pyrophosphohydrolase|nr:phosphoribosyl-ATP diphosphatase [Alphaproteobacteria bacterium]
MSDTPETADSAVLERLYAVIESRRGADPDSSYTAKLFAKGTPKIAQKVGEEAVEAVIEAMAGDRDRLAEESADLLYHLLVLWAAADVKPAEVWRALAKREGKTGLRK